MQFQLDKTHMLLQMLRWELSKTFQQHTAYNLQIQRLHMFLVHTKYMLQLTTLQQLKMQFQQDMKDMKLLMLRRGLLNTFQQHTLCTTKLQQTNTFLPGTFGTLGTNWHR
jgi:hypothetical protein